MKNLRINIVQTTLTHNLFGLCLDLILLWSLRKILLACWRKLKCVKTLTPQDFFVHEMATQRRLK